MANPQLLLSEMKAIMVRDDVTGQHKHLLSRSVFKLFLHIVWILCICLTMGIFIYSQFHSILVRLNSLVWRWNVLLIHGLILDIVVKSWGSKPPITVNSRVFRVLWLTFSYHSMLKPHCLEILVRCSGFYVCFINFEITNIYQFSFFCNTCTNFQGADNLFKCVRWDGHSPWENWWPHVLSLIYLTTVCGVPLCRWSW